VFEVCHAIPAALRSCGSGSFSPSTLSVELAASDGGES